MRVFIAGLAHESNRLSPLPTGLDSYREAGISEGGRAALERDPFLAGMGIPRLLRRHRLDASFGFFTYAQPGGLTVRPAYEALRDKLFDALAAAPRPDLVFLFLHGAMMADGCDDCEADLLAGIRRILGPAVPVGALFDLHGNITPAMVETGAILVGCREYPHVDFDVRAAQLFQLLVRAARREITPVTALVRVPMLGFFPTTPQPMRGFVDEVAALEGDGGILAVTLCHGFPWADWEGAGAGVLVTADGDRDTAARVAGAVADRFFRLYPAINAPPMLSPRAAVLAAREAQAGPVVIADASDNPGGGAGSDSTFLLSELLDQKVESAALGLLYDPGATAIAHQLGEGATWRMRIGGKVGPCSGPPVDLDVRVVACLEGVTQHGFNAKLPLRRTARVDAGGISIILSEQRCQTFDPVCFSAHGVDPASRKVIIVKSSQHFRALFAPLAAEILYADAGGALSFAFTEERFHRVSRPVHPLDPAPFSRDGRLWTLDPAARS